MGRHRIEAGRGDIYELPASAARRQKQVPDDIDNTAYELLSCTVLFCALACTAACSYGMFLLCRALWRIWR